MSVINEITIDKFIFELKGKINEEDYIYIKILNKTINYTFYVYRSNSDLGVFRYAMYIMGYRKQFYKGKNYVTTTCVHYLLQKFIIERMNELELLVEEISLPTSFFFPFKTDSGSKTNILPYSCVKTIPNIEEKDVDKITMHDIVESRFYNDIYLDIFSRKDENNQITSLKNILTQIYNLYDKVNFNITKINEKIKELTSKISDNKDTEEFLEVHMPHFIDNGYLKISKYFEKMLSMSVEEGNSENILLINKITKYINVLYNFKLLIKNTEKIMFDIGKKISIKFPEDGNISENYLNTISTMSEVDILKQINSSDGNNQDDACSNFNIMLQYIDCISKYFENIMYEVRDSYNKIYNETYIIPKINVKILIETYTVETMIKNEHSKRYIWYCCKFSYESKNKVTKFPFHIIINMVPKDSEITFMGLHSKYVDLNIYIYKAFDYLKQISGLYNHTKKIYTERSHENVYGFIGDIYDSQFPTTEYINDEISKIKKFQYLTKLDINNISSDINILRILNSSKDKIEQDEYIHIGDIIFTNYIKEEEKLYTCNNVHNKRVSKIRDELLYFINKLKECFNNRLTIEDVLFITDKNTKIIEVYKRIVDIEKKNKDLGIIIIRKQNIIILDLYKLTHDGLFGGYNSKAIKYIRKINYLKYK